MKIENKHYELVGRLRQERDHYELGVDTEDRERFETLREIVKLCEAGLKIALIDKLAIQSLKDKTAAVWLEAERPESHCFGRGIVQGIDEFAAMLQTEV